MGLTRTLLVIDPRLLRPADGAHRPSSRCKRPRSEFEVFEGVEVEPTDRSFHEAIAVAPEGKFDSFVAVGGGSAIDTAKAANLYSTYPGRLSRLCQRADRPRQSRCPDR